MLRAGLQVALDVSGMSRVALPEGIGLELR